MVKKHCAVTCWVMRSSSSPAPLMLVDASMWVQKTRLPCWPSRPEVNLRNSIQTRKHTSKKTTLAIKPNADITRSPKQGCQWPHKKDICPPTIKKSPVLLEIHKMYYMYHIICVLYHENKKEKTVYKIHINLSKKMTK